MKAEPLQYILGKTEFMGLEFQVGHSVLIPRQETEILVEKAIELVKRYQVPCTKYRVLEIGTGCGCIAISLAKFLTDIEIDAIDISQEALLIARNNAKLHNATNKIRFLESDLFPRSPVPGPRYDLIISNPPYIPSSEISQLQPEIAYEPRIALDGGEDGLDFYRKIALSCAKFLKERGRLIMEIGFGQLSGVRNIFEEAKNFEVIEAIKDYNNIDRVVIIEKR